MIRSLKMTSLLKGLLLCSTLLVNNNNNTTLFGNANKTTNLEDNYNKATHLLSQSSYAELISNNEQLAQRLKKEACDLNLGRACWYYAYQTNNTEDMKHAENILTKDCFATPTTISSGESCTYLGIMLSQGKATTSLNEEELYFMGCNLNDGWGCYRLAKDFLSYENLEEAKEKNDKALQILTNECESNIGSSCYLVGSIYEQPFTENWIDSHKQTRMIQYFYNKGCELGDGDSCAAKQ